MNIFESLAEKGFCKITKYSYMVDCQGHYIYKFPSAKIRNMFLEEFKTKGIEVTHHKEDKVYFLHLNNYYIGACM